MNEPATFPTFYVQDADGVTITQPIRLSAARLVAVATGSAAVIVDAATGNRAEWGGWVYVAGEIFPVHCEYMV